MENEIKYLKKKLGRKNSDIINIRHKLDQTLDKLDVLQVEFDKQGDTVIEMVNEIVIYHKEYEALRDYYIEKEGKHVYRDKFAYVPKLPINQCCYFQKQDISQK